ncbi:DNA binding HTH domain Psq-type [Trinorchestia longiramus]|nr:DNA binding HTH domain Psq-type [Trinorchestia longiramus]
MPSEKDTKSSVDSHSPSVVLVTRQLTQRYTLFHFPAYLVNLRSKPLKIGPKKNVSDSGRVKKNNVRTTIELKKEIIAKFEDGVRVSDLATQYGMAKSTTSTFLKKKEELRGANIAKGVTSLTKKRPQILEEVEKLLLIFINEKKLHGDSISEAFICEKALRIYEDLLKKSKLT